jgi:ABC-type transport system involved in multi-copper enzyme maturation permease subunit
MNASARLNTAGVIARREAMAAARGLGGYIALTIALLVASWSLLVDVQALDTAGLLVQSEPFRAPLTFAVLVFSLFLAVSAAVSAARDRESGTLEILFYGPVDELVYVAGKIGGLLIAYIAAQPLILIPLFLLSMITGFLISPIILVSIALSILPAAAIISFGVLLSVGTSRVRSAVLLLTGITALLIGITLAYKLILLVPISDVSSPLLVLRDALGMLDGVVRWISPFAYLERVVDTAMSGAWGAALTNSAIVLGGIAGMTALAVLWLRHRGVYRRAE